VIRFRRQEKQKFTELLSTRVPLKLSELMDSENHAAATRAAISLEDMAQQGRAEPTRRIQTGGIVIVLGAPTQQALPAGSAMPVLEMEPEDEH
jgi:outer membrane receptor protein involved in Fe transport